MSEYHSKQYKERSILEIPGTICALLTVLFAFFYAWSLIPEDGEVRFWPLIVNLIVIGGMLRIITAVDIPRKKPFPD